MEMEGKLNRTVLVGAAALAVCVVAMSGSVVYGNGTSTPLWFIGLLVIIMSALTLTAIVFGGLKLSDPSEAFGLPSGSVRTLLAVGIMVLFTVFGLRFFDDAASSDMAPRISAEPLQSVVLPAAEAAAAEGRYREDGFVVVSAPSQAASGSAGAGTVTLHLHTQKGSRSAEAIDVQKQLLTAIVTLLTTVVGFYFGSRSASEGQRQRGEPAGDGGGLGPLIDPLLADGTAAASALQTRRDALGVLRDDPLPGDAARAAEAAEALSRALELDTAAQAAQQRLAEALAAVREKAAAVAVAAPGSDRKAREDEARRAIESARPVVADAQAQARLLADAVAALTALGAEG